jgi:hypothetical protein
VVVDELDAGVAALVVGPWPTVDDRGRLRFAGEDRHVRVVASAESLESALRERRVPVVGTAVDDDTARQLRERPIAVGDAFGAWLAERPLEEGADVGDAREWLTGRVIDVTVAAREMAKAQTYAADAGVLSEEELEQLASEFRESDEPPGPQGPADPSGGGPPVAPTPGGGDAGTDLGALEPWRPAALGGIEPEVLRRSSYLVVDELQEGVAVLVVSPWPVVDERGRMRFGGEEGRVRVAVGAGALEALLAERRVPVVDGALAPEVATQLRVRPVEVGDVFAARPAFLPGEDGADVGDPAGWLPGPVLDITATAREATKAQASAALAGVLTQEQVEQIVAEMQELST